MAFDDITIDAPWNGQRGGYGYYIAGARQTLDETIDSGFIGHRDVAIYLNSAGSVDTYALGFGNNSIDWYLNNVIDRVLETASDSEGAYQHLYVAFADTN